MLKKPWLKARFKTLPTNVAVPQFWRSMQMCERCTDRNTSLASKWLTVLRCINDNWQVVNTLSASIIMHINKVTPYTQTLGPVVLQTKKYVSNANNTAETEKLVARWRSSLRHLTQRLWILVPPGPLLSNNLEQIIYTCGAQTNSASISMG